MFLPGLPSDRFTLDRPEGFIYTINKPDVKESLEDIIKKFNDYIAEQVKKPSSSTNHELKASIKVRKEVARILNFDPDHPEQIKNLDFFAADNLDEIESLLLGLHNAQVYLTHFKDTSGSGFSMNKAALSLLAKIPKKTPQKSFDRAFTRSKHSSAFAFALNQNIYLPILTSQPGFPKETAGTPPAKQKIVNDGILPSQDILPQTRQATEHVQNQGELSVNSQVEQNAERSTATTEIVANHPSYKLILNDYNDDFPGGQIDLPFELIDESF